MDGVPVISQPAVMPGESFTYEYTVRNAGSHMYHSHFMAETQVPMGLLGAFIVTDPNATDEPESDIDYTMILNDGPLGFTINGKGFPATEPIVAQQGQTVRIRYMNEGLQIHPMHLHGMPQLVVAKDGWTLPTPQLEDTVLVAPGERIDVIVDATELGTWAFHCHILTHAEGPDGMFGMVTALIVQERVMVTAAMDARAAARWLRARGVLRLQRSRSVAGPCARRDPWAAPRVPAPTDSELRRFAVDLRLRVGGRRSPRHVRQGSLPGPRRATAHGTRLGGGGQLAGIDARPALPRVLGHDSLATR